MATAPVEMRKAAPAPTGTADAWRSFRTEIDRLFDRFTTDLTWPSLQRVFDDRSIFALRPSFTSSTPAMDVSEDVNGYRLTAELPGMSEKDIEVVVSDGMLTLTGEKKQETEQKDKNYYLSEREYGSFKRSFTLPDGIDADRISAEFAKGVLTITLPKKPEAKAAPKKIDVKAAA
ncbi:MAG TPA: Hsp20/alpha crystallin family protein [Acetobacteraceae bacterium]|nr:Hsp20/alpha crystallin family protein [Acetobacteraceae bacterium]